MEASEDDLTGSHSRAIMSTEGRDVSGCNHGFHAAPDLPQQITISGSNACLKSTIKLATQPFLPCLPLLVYQCFENKDVISRAEVFSESCLPHGFDSVILGLCSFASIIANNLGIREATVMPL